jgi:hypothetical protein
MINTNWDQRVVGCHDDDDRWPIYLTTSLWWQSVEDREIGAGIDGV